ncbi:LIM and calponin homology domains-containing protein 1-like isoform X2 [Corythoichthys intestinalis]|uniref:LIM and calponin homology domains-containing protein 1-like isoform X2 n=1 Tax=Corythoichthys intestinalis TaxID=161448 RepID=UPI0025A4F421|nr:LIM and calponin homology domains-containing protein 1-like isoform X2 [Corythoichthys intestinalis]
MASSPAGHDVRPESAEASRPEPACLEAQKWIEAVTGKSFGDKDFRSALENGILLCELLSAIRPGLVKKINRLPTPIAGLDNLSVFLRGCEELGLKGSQLFDPGDLQDTSVRANLKDSDCCRKLKNVLNTVFWLGKAASGCASYSGPTLHLKEFEGLLANMKDGEEGADGSQKRSVRDSGYDCWDSERSDSLSPPRHTRDNSLDSLDSFGSRSQHSPSPDVVNRGNMEGREADPDADGGRRPDVQKDDMSARRAASGEARNPVVFNQFLPNRSNAGLYVPNARRRPHAEDGEQRSLPGEQQPCDDPYAGSPEFPRAPAEPDAGLAEREQSFKEEEEDEKMPDVQKDDMMARRTGIFHNRSSALSSYNRFLPSPASKSKVQVADKSRNVRTEEGLTDNRHQNEVLPQTETTTSGTGCLLKSNAAFRRFLPMPGALKNHTGESSGTERAPKMSEKRLTESGDDLPPMMMSRRVAFAPEDGQSVSMGDMAEQEEAEQSRYERMQEQYNHFQDEDDQWQSDLARWKSRRRCASQELIKKEEERKRMEMLNGDKRKSIKTYKEIVEEKERREAELCEAYGNAATPEEAAMVLQRYALRFTISEATLDFLKLPRLSPDPELIRDTGEPESTYEDGQQNNPPSCESTPPQGQEPRYLPSQSSPSEPEPAAESDPEPRLRPPKPERTPPDPAKPAPASSRPVPLLAAKPYRRPRGSHGAKTDGLVRVTGDADASLIHSPSEKDASPSTSKPAESPPPPLAASTSTPAASPSTLAESQPPPPAASTSTPAESPPPPLAASTSTPADGSPPPPPSASFSSSSSSSTISSLFSGRNCVTKTTIVTELTQTLVEDQSQVNGSVTTAEEKQAESVSTSTSVSSVQEGRPGVTDVRQESTISEQYQKEQEKLKKEWEKAQAEVQEEERKHNEEERKILEETVTPLKPHSGGAMPPPPPPPGDRESVDRPVASRQNGYKDTPGNEEQHKPQLHFLQDGEPSSKSQLWKTASLDRNAQADLPTHGVKRCGSHDGFAGTQTKSSPSRCITGKRQCSGCSRPLGKGAAMIIETLGLFFHVPCFKCGVCEGELGSDVRIRNGLLSCHRCYVTATGAGQPTTL